MKLAVEDRVDSNDRIVRTQKTLSRSLEKLITPVVRLALRHGFTFQSFVTVVKHAYLKVASVEYVLERKRQTKARIALLTGMTRPDVRDLMAEAINDEFTPPSKWNRAANVLDGWCSDAQFLDKHGQPRALTKIGDSPEFAELVRRYGADIPMRAMFDELHRVGCVDVNEAGLVHMVDPKVSPELGDVEAIITLGYQGEAHLAQLSDKVLP